MNHDTKYSPENGYDGTNISKGDYLVKRNKKMDLFAKIVCVIAALMFWFYVMYVDSPENRQIFSPIAVELSGMSEIATQHDLSVYSGLGHSVEVTVKGKQSDINRISPKDIVAYVDVSSITQAGDYQLEVYVILPSSLTLESVSPSTLNVYVDEKSSVTLQISPKITNLVVEAPNQAGTPVIENSDITVTGPKKLIDSLSHAQVNLDVGKTGVTVNLISNEIVLIKKNGEVQAVTSNIKLSKSEVAVRIPIYTYKEIPLSVAFKHGYFNDSNVDIQITPATVRVKGDPGLLEKYDTLTIATLDEKMVNDSERQQVLLTLPEGMENANQVEYATIDIKQKNTLTREFHLPRERIQVVNPGNLSYEIMDHYITVRFRGHSAEIQNMRNIEVSALIDLSGYSAQTSGSMPLLLTVLLADTVGDSIYELGEYRVQVNINS